MPSDTTLTATDAAPAVKVGDKVVGTPASDYAGERGKVLHVTRRGTIAVQWQTGQHSYTPKTFALCCTLKLRKPSRRALREQLQQERTAREAAEGAAERAEQQWRIHAASEQEQRQRADAAEALLQQERDAHAQTKQALEAANVAAEVLQAMLTGAQREAERQMEGAFHNATCALRAQQELQQARGLIEDIAASHYSALDPPLQARADAFLAGTMAEAAPGTADVPEALHCCQCGGEYTAARDVRLRQIDQNGDAYMLCIYCAPLPVKEPQIVPGGVDVAQAAKGEVEPGTVNVPKPRRSKSCKNCGGHPFQPGAEELGLWHEGRCLVCRETG